MPPKTPPSTGVRKKIVKRTVRKIATPKTATPKTTVPEIPFPETTVTETATDETAVTEAPLPETTPQTGVTEIPPPETASETTANDGASEPLETAVTEIAVASEAAHETTVTATKPPAKRTTTRVRKVKKRVPVKRTPRAVGAAQEEEKGGAAAVVVEEEGKNLNFEMETTVSILAEAQNPSPIPSPNPNQPPQPESHNSDTASAISSAQGEEKGAAAAVVTEDEGKNLNFEMETTEEQNPIPNPNPNLNRNQPPQPENPNSDTAAAISAAPAAEGKVRVRRVRRVPAKRTSKAAGAAKKEEKGEAAVSAGEGAEAEYRNRNPETEATVSVPTKELLSNLSQSSEPENPDANVSTAAAEAASAPDVVLPMEKVAVPEPGNSDSDNANAGEDVPVEKEKDKGADTIDGGAGDVVTDISERQQRRKTEIFIGGLDRDAKEEDIRKVFGRVGEIVEVRLMMDGQTGKNKGYGFLRYATAAQAKQAVTEFVKVEVCGKQCGAAALEGNDTIFLGNIDKKWKKVDVIKLLQEIGIEKIDTVTVMPDPKNADSNRGFAFLELETNRDAQNAYKKLQKKDVFGKGRNIKVAWAEPLNDPDEEDMQKVKSVYAEGIPSSWDDGKVRECFKKFGEIDRVVLARNIQSAKRKDFAFVNFKTREAALSCIELFDKEDSIGGGSKVSVKVSLAKPVHKGKQNKGSGNKDYSKERSKAVPRDTKVNVRGAGGNVAGDKTSTTRELLHVLREQAAWKQGQIGYTRGPAIVDYSHVLHGGKRPLSALGDDALYSDPRVYPRARLDSAYPVASPSSLTHGMAGTSLPYYQRPSVQYGTGAVHGPADHSRTLQMRPGSAPYGSSHYSRY